MLKLTLLASLLAVSTATLADDYRFKVLGLDDQPLADVVVAIGNPTVARPTQGVMDQKNKQFAPFVLPVTMGSEVSFPNSDQIRHHVYSFSPTHPFEIKLYHGASANPVEFDEPGAVVLGCNIHDNMIGYIFVTKRPVFGATQNDGTLAFSLATSATDIDVWHPALSLDSQTQLNFKLADLEREGIYFIVNLPLAAQPENPQAIMPTARDRFRSYIKDVKK